MLPIIILDNGGAGWNNNAELALARYVHAMDTAVIYYDTAGVFPELPQRTHNGQPVMMLATSTPIPAREHAATVMFAHRGQQEFRAKVAGTRTVQYVDINTLYPDLAGDCFGHTST